jgi:unsaturated chondroitin disaccharide hydrolase
LGWALYGFAEAYRWTGDAVFLYTARRVSEYAIANAPADKVPFWDYDSLDIPNTYRDSSAASVIAAGLLELADGETDAALAQRWRTEAEAITLSLWENYSTRGTSIPAILVQASRSVPHNWMDHPLIYGDYYFVETLVRLLRPDLTAKLFPRQMMQVG